MRDRNPNELEWLLDLYNRRGFWDIKIFYFNFYITINPAHIVAQKIGPTFKINESFFVRPETFYRKSLTYELGIT